MCLSYYGEGVAGWGGGGGEWNMLFLASRGVFGFKVSQKEK